jgi:hypothetical protein
MTDGIVPGQMRLGRKRDVILRKFASQSSCHRRRRRRHRRHVVVNRRQPSSTGISRKSALMRGVLERARYALIKEKQKSLPLYLLRSQTIDPSFAFSSILLADVVAIAVFVAHSM